MEHLILSQEVILSGLHGRGERLMSHVLHGTLAVSIGASWPLLHPDYVADLGCVVGGSPLLGMQRSVKDSLLLALILFLCVSEVVVCIIAGSSRHH